MIDCASRTAAARHRASQRLDIDGWRVDVAFEEVSEGVATSAAAARLAEDLVAARIGCERQQVRVAALMPSGRPVATIFGRETEAFVSVSHGGGLVGAAVCATGGVGLDIVAAAEAGRGLDCWFTSHELAMFAGGEGRPRARLWAAKEAAYKAARLDEGFRPLAVAIEHRGTAGFRWSVRGDHRHASGQGVFTTAHGQVVAVAVAAAPMNSEHQTRIA
jgi:hypothetical protein